MKRLTADVIDGVTVFTCGRSAAGCEDAGCKAKAVAACGHALTGKMVGKVCARRFCERHMIDVAGLFLCGPHARMAMKKGSW